MLGVPEIGYTMTYESAGTALWTCRHCGEKNVTHLNEDWVCVCGMGYDGNRRFALGKRIGAIPYRIKTLRPSVER